MCFSKFWKFRISLNFHRTNLELEIFKKCSFSCMKYRWHVYFTRTRIQVLMLLLKASIFLMILGPRIHREKITTLLYLRSKSQCGVLEDLFNKALERVRHSPAESRTRNFCKYLNFDRQSSPYFVMLLDLRSQWRCTSWNPNTWCPKRLKKLSQNTPSKMYVFTN